MRFKTFAFLCLVSASAIALRIDAGYVFQDGKFIDSACLPTMPAADHFNAGVAALEACDWSEAVINFAVLTCNCPNSPYGQEALYCLGVAYYNLDELDLANCSFSEYLQVKNNPKYFEEAIEYKFAIAEKLRCGARRRFLGSKKFPKWASGKTMALKIYDEVIAALPSHELAARALYSKGCLLWYIKDYRPSVEAFQMLIRRFPKHELTPECFVLINKVYLDQSQYEFQNPDILAFSELNLRRFQHDFPREERILEAAADVLAIKEVYAQGLYNTGCFYQKIQKPIAAIIYYQNAIKQFPDTCVAQLCREHLAILAPGWLPPEESPSNPEEPGEDLSEIPDVTDSEDFNDETP